MKESNYIDGLSMEQFIHIPEISCYNNNYFIGFGRDLLFGKSDDDNITNWYIVDNNSFNVLGYSYCSEGNKLYRGEEIC